MSTESKELRDYSGMPSMTIDIARPRPRLPGQTRQQQIIETVLDLVAERAADGVSVQAIADRIGLTGSP
jgi:AcrR family transcriptional regulator